MNAMVPVSQWAKSQEPEPRLPARFLPLARLRKLRECEQVGAVCYRLWRGRIEFLLVRTRSGRWIFPKGSTEPGLTHAQAAALEAYEEAGVHGRMEEASFSQYRRPNRRGNKSELIVKVHLCQVSRLEPPPESGRNPTWFAAGETMRNLRADRSPEYGSQLARMIERAVKRIQISNPRPAKPDALQKVRFINEVRS